MSRSPLFYAALTGFSMLFCISGAIAQDAPQPETRPIPPGGRFVEVRRPGGMSEQGIGSPIFVRMLSKPEFLKELGIPEETAKKIIDSLGEIDERSKELLKEREEKMKKRTELVAGLMSDRAKTPEEARKAVADYSEVMTKLGELHIERMLVIRDNLTDEQINKASELVKANARKYREEMIRRRTGAAQVPTQPPSPGVISTPPVQAKPESPAAVEDKVSEEK